MCDLAGPGGTARVVKSWQYDAYGQCLRATDVVTPTSQYSIPINRIGHKGLFMDRLDVGLANPSTYADNPRLAPFSTVLYQNRNRTYFRRGCGANALSDFGNGLWLIHRVGEWI